MIRLRNLLLGAGIICLTAVMAAAAPKVPSRPLPPNMTWDPKEVWQDLDLQKDDGKWHEDPTSQNLSKVKGRDVTNGAGGTVTAIAPGFKKEGPDNAFDNSDAKYCVNSKSMWIQYQFPAGIRPRVTGYTITSANDSPDRDPRDWRLLGSNNGGKTWAVVDEQRGQSFPGRFVKRGWKTAKPDAYNVYRLDVTANHGDVSSQISELEFLVPDDGAKAHR